MSVFNGIMTMFLLLGLCSLCHAQSTDSISYSQFQNSIRERLIKGGERRLSSHERLVQSEYNIVIDPPYPWVLDTSVGGFFELSIPGAFVTAYVDARDFDNENHGKGDNDEMARWYSHSFLFRYEHDARHYFESDIWVTSSYVLDTIFETKGKEIPFGSGGLMLLIDAGMTVVNPIHYKYLGGTSHVTCIYAELGSFKTHEEDMYALLEAISFYKINPLAVSVVDGTRRDDVSVRDGKLWLSLDDEAYLQVSLFDLQGRLIRDLFKGHHKGEATIPLPIDIGSGLRLLRVIGEKSYTQKLYVK